MMGPRPEDNRTADSKGILDNSRTFHIFYIFYIWCSSFFTVHNQ